MQSHWNRRKETEGKKIKLMLSIVVFGLSHGCSDWWGFELYLTPGSVSVFVCTGIWLTLVWWCICPVDRLQRRKSKAGRARERLRTRWETEMDWPDKQADVYGPLFTSSLIWAISSPLAMDSLVGHAAWTPPPVVIHLPPVKLRESETDGWLCRRKKEKPAAPFYGWLMVFVKTGPSNIKDD